MLDSARQAARLDVLKLSLQTDPGTLVRALAGFLRRCDRPEHLRGSANTSYYIARGMFSKCEQVENLASSLTRGVLCLANGFKF